MPPTQPTIRITARELRWLRHLVIICAILPILLFLATARLRLHYPFAFNENGMLQMAMRVHDGLPLYTEPSVTYTPYLYTPVFYYFAALSIHFFGATFTALRVVSIFSTLGVFALLYALVFTETRRAWAALAAVGCFAACYPLVLNWFDTGRVDMLYLFFLMAAVLATRRGHPALAAILWVLTFQTKQGVLPIAFLALCYDWQHPRRVLTGLITFFAALAASILWLTHITGGWYRYYIFGIVGGFGFDRHLIVHILPNDFLAPLGIALLIILAAFLAAPPHWRTPAFSFYGLGCLSFILFTAYIRAHRGAGQNTLLPAYLWIAILFGLALARLETHLKLQHTATAILLLAATVQLTAHIYWPTALAPHPDELALRNRFLDQLRTIPGNVLVYEFPEYGRFAGKPMYAVMDATGAVIEAKNQQQGNRLLAQYQQLIDSHQLSAVALDRPAEDFLAQPRSWMPANFLQRFPLKIPVQSSEDTPYIFQPRWLYLPCEQSTTAQALDPQVDLSGCQPLAAPKPPDSTRSSNSRQDGVAPS